jgi:hypothetical protein
MAAAKRAPLTASLIAVTGEALASLGGRREIRLAAFPFNVGRESRLRAFEKLKSQLDRRLGGGPEVNDLYLLEPPAPLLHISRAHFLIDYIDDRFVLVDRESACGTIVAGKMIGGGGSSEYADLRDGDTIVVGGDESPYVFEFQIKS